MLLNKLFFKYIKKTDIYLITNYNNTTLSNFNIKSYKNKSYIYSKSLYKYNLFFRHLYLFGLLPILNQKEFKIN